MKGRFLNSGQNGQLMGYDCDLVGHEKWCLFWTKPVFEFHLSRNHPLTYRANDGTLYQPDRHFVFDWGSVPPPLQGLPNLIHDRFLFYPFHDSAYMDGGLWVVSPEIRADNYLDLVTNRQFVKLPRKKADDLLREAIPNDPTPGSIVVAGAVWSAVRAGGVFCNYGKAGDVRRRKAA